MVRVMRDQTTAGGAAVRAAEPIEVIQDRLYAVGGTVTLDEKVTWGPGDGSLQPVLAYLALGAEVPTLIDAGLKVHEAAIAEQLGSLLPAGSRISVFLTRAEYDCFGGLAAVADQYQIERIYTGGTQNPFDAFGEVTGFTASWDQRVQLGRQPPGHSEVLEAAGGLEVLTPALRILATHWAYLPRLKTLFTSDLFGHTSLPTPGSSWVIDGDGDDDTTPESLAGHLTARSRPSTGRSSTSTTRTICWTASAPSWSTPASPPRGHRSTPTWTSSWVIARSITSFRPTPRSPTRATSPGCS
jgi:hypothetical protein